MPNALLGGMSTGRNDDSYCPISDGMLNKQKYKGLHHVTQMPTSMPIASELLSTKQKNRHLGLDALTHFTNSLTGIVLFSVPRDGNQGLKNAIFRP